jgi:DNA-binding response OmpR family regulator
MWTILVVDDDLGLRDLVIAFLSEPGCTVPPRQIAMKHYAFSPSVPLIS